MQSLAQISIRLFEENDALQVSNVIRQTMMKTNTDDYPLSILTKLHDYFTPSKVSILASERYCLVVVYNETIIATGALELNELKTIFVLPQYQELGIGKRLIQKLEEYAISQNIFKVNVPASITGIGFYEKVGYQKKSTFLSKHAGQQTWMSKELVKKDSH